MELVTTSLQTIQPNEVILFDAVSVSGSPSIIWRAGSGIITLRGISQTQYRARFKVNFGANVAIPDGETVGSITLAFAINGETINSSRMVSTPLDVEEFNNVFREIYLDIPTGCCSQLTVRNLSEVPILLDAGNLIVERVA